MKKPMMARACALQLGVRSLAWPLLLAVFGVAAQTPSTPSAPSPGLPVLPPPVPKPGPFPWQMPRPDRFYTDSNELKAFLEKSNKPDRRLEEFRVDMERSRFKLEQERVSNKINSEDYSQGISDYGKSITLYRDLKRQGLSGSR